MTKTNALKTSNGSGKNQGFRRIWRWHSRAGILIAPLLLVMVITGGIYLLEPQIEDLQYSGLLYLQEPYSGTVGHSALAAQIEKTYPQSRILHYRPAQSPAESAQFLIDTQKGETLTVFLHPGEQRLLGAIDERYRLTSVAKKIHGGLMAGIAGEVIVELVACWTMLMVVSGLYLWWPRTLRLRGALIPRSGGAMLRDLHAIPGALLGLWILAIIATGLPWSVVWGGLLEQGGKIAGEALPKEVFVARPQSGQAHGKARLELNAVMRVVEGQSFNYAYRIDYPWEPHGSFTVFPLRRGGEAQDMAYFFIDQYSGALLHQIRWPQMGAVGRATAIGVALHEGRLFGTANQLLNLAALLVLIALTTIGCLMWWRRRSRAAAPRTVPGDVPAGLKWTLIVIAVLLPLAGLTMLAIWLWDQWRRRDEEIRATAL